METMLKDVAEAEVKKVINPTRDELQNNIRVSEAWLKALERGTFVGSDTATISGLLGFLKHQNKISIEEYERESLTHPEWGTRPA